MGKGGVVFMGISRKRKSCAKPQESRSKDLCSQGKRGESRVGKMKGAGCRVGPQARSMAGSLAAVC